MPADKIFICYRRDDSAGHAGRLYDRLNQRFPGRVFMDVAGISVGTRWAEVIEKTLRSCGVIVILIGKRWLERGANGERRIDHPADSTRAEIMTALRLNTRVVPLLVAGAAMPDGKDLPADVAPIADWQALRIDDDDFDHDATRLLHALEDQLGDAKSDPRLKTAAIREAELRQLMIDAESAISRRDWVSATQTLNAVLSLDRSHAEAVSRLHFVQQAAAASAPPVPRRDVSPPPPFPQQTLPRQTAPQQTLPQPARSRTGRWAAFAAGALAILVLGAILAYREEPVEPTMPITPEAASVQNDPQVPAQPVTQTRDTKIVNDPPPARQPSEAPARQESRETVPSMAGHYALASYYMQGNPMALAASMQLIPIRDGVFQFHTFTMDQTNGARFEYHGLFQWAGTFWTVTTTQTNDPTMVGGPVANQVQFDGTTLAVQNNYGQSFIWRKQVAGQ